MSAKEYLTDDEKQWAAAGLGVQASAMHKTKPREGDMTGRVSLPDNAVPVNPPEGAPAGRYLIGQRVILNGFEIGTVCAPETKALPNTDTEVWVHSPSRGHASRYAVHNIRPLPGGQL